MTFDSAGLTAGTYTGTLCVNSDDPVTPLVEVPLEMTVVVTPVIDVDPLSMSSMQLPDTQVDQTLTISNLGDGDLDWLVEEGETGMYVTPLAAPGQATAVASQAPSQMLSSISAQAAAGDSSVTPNADVGLIIDDGTQEAGLVLRDPNTLIEFHGVIFNHFDLDSLFFPFSLEEIHVHENTNNLVGMDIQLLVYTNTSGSLTDSTLVYTEVVTVQTQTGWNIYTLANPVIIEEPADILVGFSVIYADGGVPWPGDRFPYPRDTSSPSQARSYIAFMNTTSDTVDVSDLSSFPNFFEMAGIGLPSNWLIRGYGQGGCLGDIPWASANPTNGSTAPNASSDVTVTFDSTGLGAGTYTGDLCVSSNDPVNPLVKVPLTLTVFLNEAPVAVDDSYTTMEDTPLSVPAPGVLANDTDGDGDPLMAVLDSNPSNGSVTLNSDGSFSYTPDAGFFGTDSFTYHANDGVADSNVATVTITVEQGEFNLYLPVVIKDATAQAGVETSEDIAARNDGWAFASLAALPIMLGMLLPFRRRNSRFDS